MRTRRSTGAPATPPARGIDALAVRVFGLVEAIPRGRVLAYGDLAKALGVGPRQVAKVMSTRADDGLPWWRVVRSDGGCAPGVKAEQERRLRAEAVAMRPGGRVDMAKARWAVE